MPLCPQITNTPVLVPSQVAITGVSFTSTTATYTASGHSYIAGDVVVITGLLPAGYNGTFTISSISGSTSFTVPNTTNASPTDQSGLATPGGNYVTSSVVPVLAADTVQLTAVENTANAASQTATDAFNAAVAAGTAASTAQTTANGKNKVVYATSGPGSTANAVGDIWFQYGTAAPNVGRIIAQFIGAGGTSWTQTTVSGLVIANIDAGSITTGTISVGLGITTGTGTFTVNALTGALFANSAQITGEITATSGTISGALSVTGSLTGGTIQTSSGSNAIVLDGANNALGIKFGGSFAGFLIGIGSGAFAMHYGTSPSSVGYPRAAMSSTAATLSGTASAGYSANSDGTNTIAGITRFFNSVQVDQSITAGSSGSLFEFLSSSGNVRVAQTYSQSVSGRAMQISSAGLYGTTASTLRKKHEIASYKIDSAALLALDVKTFKYKPEIDEAQDVQYGFIAEEAQELGLDELIQYDSTGIPDYFAYEKLPIFLLQLAQEQEARIKALEGA